MCGMKIARIIDLDLGGVKNVALLPRTVGCVAIIDAMNMVPSPANYVSPDSHLSTTQVGEPLTHLSERCQFEQLDATGWIELTFSRSRFGARNIRPLASMFCPLSDSGLNGVTLTS